MSGAVIRRYSDGSEAAGPAARAAVLIALRRIFPPNGGRGRIGYSLSGVEAGAGRR